jgi:hypothetical protein
MLSAWPRPPGRLCARYEPYSQMVMEPIFELARCGLVPMP